MILQRNYDFSAFPIQTLRIYINEHIFAHIVTSLHKRGTRILALFKLTLPRHNHAQLQCVKKGLFIRHHNYYILLRWWDFFFYKQFSAYIQIMDENLRAQKNCLHLSRVNSYIRLMIHFKLSERQKKKTPPPPLFTINSSVNVNRCNAKYKHP